MLTNQQQRFTAAEMPPLDPFAAAILAELITSRTPGVTSLPRLAKRLGLGASAVMRQLTLMGDAVLGGQAGPGWVQVVQTEDRWLVQLTEAGQQAAAALVSCA